MKRILNERGLNFEFLEIHIPGQEGPSGSTFYEVTLVDEFLPKFGVGAEIFFYLCFDLGREIDISATVLLWQERSPKLTVVDLGASIVVYVIQT